MKIIDVYEFLPPHTTQTRSIVAEYIESWTGGYSDTRNKEITTLRLFDKQTVTIEESRRDFERRYDDLMNSLGLYASEPGNQKRYIQPPPEGFNPPKREGVVSEEAIRFSYGPDVVAVEMMLEMNRLAWALANKFIHVNDLDQVVINCENQAEAERIKNLWIKFLERIK